MVGDPLTAVIICIYAGDRLDWFQQSIASIVTQSIGADRIHIYLGIDGPVSPSVEEYLSREKHLFYKIVRNSANEGLTRTLNRLIEALEDEAFVFRLDADDYCAPERFEKQVCFLLEHPDIEVLGSSVVEIDDLGRSVFQRNYPVGNEDIRRTIHRANPLAHSAVCFRKSFFNKLRGYPDSITYNQDLALWFEGLRHGIRFANLSDPLVFMRVNQDFYRRRARKRAWDELRIYLRGIHGLHGLSYRHVVPFFRFLFRFLPVALIRLTYASPIRSKLTS